MPNNENQDWGYEKHFAVEGEITISAFTVVRACSWEEARRKATKQLKALEGAKSAKAIVIASGEAKDLNFFPIYEIKSLTKDLAEFLIGMDPGFLQLSGVKSLDVETALALSKYRGDLRLGISSLDEAIADALTRPLSYDDEEMDEEPGGELTLDQVTSISPSVARMLVKRNCHLYLGLNPLSVEVASILAECAGNLTFDGIEVLSEEIAEVLSKHSHDLMLPGVKQMSTQAAELLSKKAGPYWLFLDYFFEMPEEIQRILKTKNFCGM